LGLIVALTVPSHGNRVALVTIACYFAVMAVVVHGLFEDTVDLAVWESEMDGDRSLQLLAAPSICKANVEILHDGCRRNELHVTAPAVRVLDVVLRNQQQDSSDECTTQYQANITFPEDREVLIPQLSTTSVNRIGENETLVTGEATTAFTGFLPQLEYWMFCNRAVEGRPFIDMTGKPLEATVRTSEISEKQWSMEGNSRIKPVAQASSRMHKNHEARISLGKDWIRRGLAEHASISSFAAFTIALMSNQAPPDLVQASLAAASDEVRHATISFEVASYFLDHKAVEPGPLPQSFHHFEQNATALALSTAREGCIDETLSALVAAHYNSRKIE